MTKFVSGDVVSGEWGVQVIKDIYVNGEGDALYKMRGIGRRHSTYLPCKVVDAKCALCDSDSFIHEDVMTKMLFCVNELLESRDVLPRETISILFEIAGLTSIGYENIVLEGGQDD